MDEKDFVAAFSRTGSINKTALEIGCSQHRTRKILSSEEIILNETHAAILRLYADGLNAAEISSKLSISEGVIKSYLPAVRPYYKMHRSKNAIRIMKCRQKKNTDTA